MLALLIVALAVWLHNFAAPAALAAAGGLTASGRRRAALTFALLQAALPVLGLLFGRALHPRLGEVGAHWAAITLLTGAALWDLFQPAEYTAVALPVADNPDYAGAVAADGVAPALLLGWRALWLNLDAAVVGLGLGMGGAAAWSGALALVAAALLALPTGLAEGDTEAWGIRVPRAGSYLLLVATAVLAIDLLAL